METHSSVTVIIPVINEAEKIADCLTAVFNQAYSPIEVIVVDGHSKDKTVVNSSRFPVRILYEDYHSRAGACKVGVENARGDYIAFTDADCLPQSDWLENLIKEFNADIVGVGGGISNLGNGLWERSINLSMGTFLGSANSVQGRYFTNRRFVKSISGCNSIYRKVDILKVGGLDVSLSTAEDTDLNAKLLRIGKLLYTPNAIVSHNHQRGLKAFSKRMYQYGYGRAKSRLWDLQVIPPILVPLLFLSLFFTPYIFPVMIGFYAIILLLMGFKFMRQEKNVSYLISVPIIYFLEHTLYVCGFWRGFFNSLISSKSYFPEVFE
jgi:glycosyltransferase involved in cell wall biosynthesis